MRIKSSVKTEWKSARGVGGCPPLLSFTEDEDVDEDVVVDVDVAVDVDVGHLPPRMAKPLAKLFTTSDG